MALLNGGAKDKSRQNPFHYSHSVIQMSTYGVGDRSWLVGWLFWV